MLLRKLPRRKTNSSFRKRWKSEEETTNNDSLGDNGISMVDLCVCNKPDEIENEEEEEKHN